MARRDTEDGKRGALGERDRFWLGHVEAMSAQGGTATAYAAKHGLSIGALYEARRRLAARRAPAPRASRPSRVPQSKRAPVFAQVTLPGSPPGPTGSGALRVRLASGIVLEWSPPPSIEMLCGLLDRIESSR